MCLNDGRGYISASMTEEVIFVLHAMTTKVISVSQ